MSQLNISTLANLAGSETTPIADVVNGSARAWVNFNGTGTVAIRASYNVSSITDIGTGNYAINFATDMADINYCPTSGTIDPAFSSNSLTGYIENTSVSSARFTAKASNGGSYDMSAYYVSFHGNI